MASNEITVDLSDTIDFLESIQDRLENPKKMHDIISETMISDFSQHFEDEVGPDGTPWEDLAPSTIKNRKKTGHWPGKKLQVQGRGSGLLGSLQPKSSATSAAVTTNKPYAAIHHFGGQAGPGKKVTIPARPWAYLSDEAIEQIKNTIKKHLNP